MILRKYSVEEILEIEAAAVSNIPNTNPYEKAVTALHTSLEAHGTIIVTGVGKAGDIGRKISSTFNSVGLRSIFISPLDALHGDLGVVHPGSTILALSNSGKTREVGEFMAIARKLHKKIPIIAITGGVTSPIAKAATIVLSTGNPREAESMNLVPTASALAMLAIGDVLTILSMQERNFSAKEYHAHHHGGYIGKRARKLAYKKSRR
jgi:arabinose-5-phosphate isomerase